MSRWWTFIAERFPPGSYLPLVVVFVLANLAVAGARPEEAGLALVVAPVVVLSFFLRLRCFDELKDLDVDRAINPERPLARGLIEVGEVKRVIAALTVLEVGLCALLGEAALLGHGLAIVYSYLMYNEFFLGRWLRPHLTLYAITHTWSSALLGWSVAAMVLSTAPWALPPAVLVFALANWALFNVFEFARKTYAPAEEREQVETYSANFGAWGAVLLTLSQVAVALAVLESIGHSGAWYLGSALLFAATGLAYAVRPQPAMAKGYRSAAGVFLVAFLGGLAVSALRG